MKNTATTKNLLLTLIPIITTTGLLCTVSCNKISKDINSNNSNVTHIPLTITTDYNLNFNQIEDSQTYSILSDLTSNEKTNISWQKTIDNLNNNYGESIETKVSHDNTSLTITIKDYIDNYQQTLINCQYIDETNDIVINSNDLITNISLCNEKIDFQKDIIAVGNTTNEINKQIVDFFEYPNDLLIKGVEDISYQYFVNILNSISFDYEYINNNYVTHPIYDTLYQSYFDTSTPILSDLSNNEDYSTIGGTFDFGYLCDNDLLIKFLPDMISEINNISKPTYTIDTSELYTTIGDTSFYKVAIKFNNIDLPYYKDIDKETGDVTFGIEHNFHYCDNCMLINPFETKLNYSSQYLVQINN